MEREQPQFLFQQIPVKSSGVKKRRGGTAFWDVTGSLGIPTTLIEVPVTFPPPTLPHGCALSGLGVPDIRGLQGSPYLFLYKEDDSKELDVDDKSIVVERLEKDGDIYTGSITGPHNPVLDGQKQKIEKQLVEAQLSWAEWQCHLFSVQGLSNIDEQERQLVSDYIGLKVTQYLALRPYLQSEALSGRIAAATQFLRDGGTYSKDMSITKGSAARERMLAESKKANELRQQLKDEKWNRKINAEIQFKILDDEAVEIRIGKQFQIAKQNQWSDWFDLSFPVTSFVTMRAISRFYPIHIAPDALEIVMTSADIDPRRPHIPISSPKKYSKQLADWIGQPYKTRGWAAETASLKEGCLPEDAFIEDASFVMRLREEKTFETWKRMDSNLFVAVFCITDRVSHMFHHYIDKEHPMYDPQTAQRYKDTIKQFYIRMDEIVGRMMEEIGDDPNTVLLVLSDHGFESWRYQVNLNQWLLQNGYLVRKRSASSGGGMGEQGKTSSKEDNFFPDVDWSKTQAYALGLGQIYINLKDREPLGIVDPSEYDALCDEIASKLVQLKDPRWMQYGDPVLIACHKRKDIWTGEYADDAHDAPDLQCGFAPGYRVSWQTCLGGIGEDIIEDNRGEMERRSLQRRRPAHTGNSSVQPENRY